MPKSDTFDNDFLKLIFNATAIANIAQNNGSAPATTLTVALHTGDPGGGGDQTTLEISYTGYARVAVNRNGGGWAVTAASVSPAAAITFPISTGGTGGTATHFSVGTGTGNKILFRGTITPAIVVSSGVTPQLTTGSSVIES